MPLKFLGFKVTCDVKFFFINKGKNKIPVAKVTRKNTCGPNKLLSPLGTRFRRKCAKHDILIGVPTESSHCYIQGLSRKATRYPGFMQLGIQ